MTRREAAWSLSASLAAHLALGAAVVLARPSRGPGAALGWRPEAITRVRLVSEGDPSGAVAEAERPAPVPRAQRRSRSVVPAAPLAAPPPPAAIPARGELTSGAMLALRGLAPEVLGSGAPAAEEGSGGFEATAGGGAGDAVALAELARRLEEAARGCYPAAARKLRLRGEVGVLFCVGEGGGASELRVERASGSALLDGAATGCVVPRALPSPGASGCFSLPVRFGVSE